MVAYVEHSDGFRGYMQAYSLGLGVVCISTFRKGYACQLQWEGTKLAVCIACTLASIPIANMRMNI